MKKLFVLIGVLALFSCSQQQEEGFQINVEIEGAQGSILLEKRGGTGLETVVTAEITDGVAVLEGKADYPQDYYISVLGQQNKAILFVENTNMTVTGNVNSLSMITATGSQTHDEYTGLTEQIGAINVEYNEKYNQLRQLATAGDTARAEEMMQEVNNLYLSAIELQKDFVIKHPGSYAAPYILVGLQEQTEIELMDSLLSGLEPNLDSVQLVVALRDKYDQLMRFAVGKTVPDFTMNDPEGNPVTFSDVYSEHKLTLLDFWAGWCAPCRQENPNVVSVYNDFKNEGFTVFGVSLDREREEWLNAIENDYLDWTHVSDLSYWDNAAAELYQVRAIPASFLVDSEGTIVARDKRGMDLRVAVAAELN